MDKALEIIMVAAILIVASVIIISLLMDQSGSLIDFSKNRTDSSDCRFGELKYQRAIDKDSCTETTAASNISDNFDDCEWTGNDVSDYC